MGWDGIGYWTSLLALLSKYSRLDSLNMQSSLRGRGRDARFQLLLPALHKKDDNEIPKEAY